MHVVSNDERREVARRLRGNSDDTLIPHRTGRHHGMGCHEAADRFWDMCDRIKVAGNYDIAFSTTSVLADLIEPSEPPYNLYSLYEAVFRRYPRHDVAIEDDEVEELVDALLDICNAPGHDVIQRPQPSEPKVKCVAEVKVDGERLEQLAHDAAVELTGIDRDALLALASWAKSNAWYFALDHEEDELRDRLTEAAEYFSEVASSIREACGEVDA